MAELGKRNMLRVVRDSSPGMYLDGGELGEILLPNRFVPRGLHPGDRIEVFVYKDSEDRLVATTETPRAMVDQVASLKVVGVNPRVGAFLDWGLAKDLLLPFREQTGPVAAGRPVLVRVYVDPKTERIAATMKVDRAPGTRTEAPGFRKGDKVGFVLTERTALGYKALVEGAYSGLLYHEGIHVPVKIGQRFKGVVRAVRADGKIDLSLDEAGFVRVAPLARRIVQALEQKGGRLRMGDASAPEEIRQAFGTSKKAFKQALGTLYKTRRIRFTRQGIELVDNREWEPGGHRAKGKPRFGQARTPGKSPGGS